VKNVRFPRDHKDGLESRYHLRAGSGRKERRDDSGPGVDQARLEVEHQRSARDPVNLKLGHQSIFRI
jgi:hypothetical protein